VIESVRIESDEDGFHLIVEGDFSDVTVGGASDFVTRSVDRANYRLSQDAAWALVDAVEPIREWRAEGERQRENVARGLDSEGHAIEYGGDDADVHPISDAEIARERADHERKRRRENG
jgi:hypothetical protein